MTSKFTLLGWIILTVLTLLGIGAAFQILATW